MSAMSPRCGNANCLALTEDGKSPSSATSVITDARSDVTPVNSGLAWEAAYPASSIMANCSISSLLGSTKSGIRLPEAVVQHQSLEDLPNEVLFHIMGFLDVNDLLSTSRVSSDHLLSARTQSTPSWHAGDSRTYNLKTIPMTQGLRNLRLIEK